MLSACTPLEQEVVSSPAGKPAFREDIFYAADGAALPYKRWLPRRPPKAAVVALHGFNDYSNAFAMPGLFFRAQGIALYAYDQRGFGQAPFPGLWGGERNLTSDLRQFVTLVKSRHPSAPIYILGESMGGALAIAALADPGFPPVEGLILVAPAVWGGDTMGLIPRVMAWAMAHTVPFAEFTGSDLEILASDNIPMLKSMSADPLILKSARADAIYGLMRLMDSAYEKLPSVRTRALLLYGACDEVIPSLPIEHTSMRLGGSVRFAHYPAGYHMLLRDLQGDRVMKDVVNWIRRPSAPLSSGNERSSRLLHGALDSTPCAGLFPVTKRFP